MMTSTSKWGFCAIAVTVLTTGAQADDLLLIDLTVANQVTISATSGVSSASVSGGTFTGVYFDNFYGGAGNSLAATLVSGNLTSADLVSDLSPALFRGGAGSDTGLNLWSWSSSGTATFTAGSQAFTGSATWSLSAAMYADMVNGSSSGTLYFPADTSDDIAAGAVAIGTYRVVPTPAALSLLGMGLGMGGMRRRR